MVLYLFSTSLDCFLYCCNKSDLLLYYFILSHTIKYYLLLYYLYFFIIKIKMYVMELYTVCSADQEVLIYSPFMHYC